MGRNIRGEKPRYGLAEDEACLRRWAEGNELEQERFCAWEVRPADVLQECVARRGLHVCLFRHYPILQVFYEAHVLKRYGYIGGNHSRTVNP